MPWDKLKLTYDFFIPLWWLDHKPSVDRNPGFDLTKLIEIHDAGFSDANDWRVSIKQNSGLSLHKACGLMI